MPASGPPLLAIETAAGAASVALWRDGALVGEATAAAGQPAAESLLPALDALLRDAGLVLDDIGAFALSIGPGSFTGIRVGVATVKGLAFGSDRRAAPVSTLAALARAADLSRDPRPVVATLDARRGEVYAASFRAGGDEPLPDVPEGVYTADELAARIRTPCVLAGEGVGICGEVLARRLGDDLELREAMPAARHVAALGALRIDRCEGLAADALAPRYVRRAEAEVKRTGLRFEGA